MVAALAVLDNGNGTMLRLTRLAVEARLPSATAATASRLLDRYAVSRAIVPASIVGGGQNAFMGHYFRKTDKLVDGDLLLMDFAPDYRYYTSDVTRMWPVNGKYTVGQRQLCESYNFV